MAQKNASNHGAEHKIHGFSIGCFNLLCPYWNNSESKHPQMWKKRHNDILNILCTNDSNGNNHNDEHKNNNTNTDDAMPSMNCDIYCLQEFWCGNEPFVRLYDNYFKARGYELHFLKRSSKRKPDGIAIVINKKTFKIINKINCKYNISNRVAVMMELRHIQSNCILNIGNTHFTFPQNEYDDDIRAQQVQEFVDLLNKNTSNSVSNMIVCGDFNCHIDGNECVYCLKDGYKSSFHMVNNIKGNVVSHMNHMRESVFVDHIFMKKNANVVKECSFTLNPIESYIYPRNIKIDTWSNDWVLSDHRPIVSKFQLKR